MREIPADALMLLKSRSMVGANKPTHKLTIQGAPGSGEINWTAIRILRGDDYYGKYYGGSFATRKDGKVLVTYQKGTDIYLSAVDSEDDIFFADNAAAANEWVFCTLNGYAEINNSVLKRLRNGDLLLFVLDIGVFGNAEKPNVLKVYKSANGLGTDFTLLATVREFNLGPYSDGRSGDQVSIGHPIQLDSGRIFVPWTGLRHWDANYYKGVNMVSYSDDDGATWTNVEVWQHNRLLSMRGIAKFGSQLAVAVCNTYSGGDMWFSVSNNDGATWSTLSAKTSARSRDGLKSQLCWGEDGYSYWLYMDAVNADKYLLYRRSDAVPLPTSGQEPYDLNDWELIYPSRIGDDGYETLFTTGEGNLAFCGTGHYEGGAKVYMLGGIREKISVYAKSISIDRSKGMASAGTVILDNKNGVYSPDSSGDWAGVLMPNVQLEIEQGYGANLVKTFTGYIDSVEMSTFPQELRLTCRDKSKLALDRIVTNAVDGGHYVKFANTTVEDAFTALAGLCGLTTGTVEETGLTLSNKMFSWESYADAFSWLAELAGFEWHVNEMGLIHFVRDVAPASPAAAYVFREGEDIISLGYTISDADLHYEAIVYGQDADGAVVKASANFGAPLTYNLFSQKALKIDAPEADTVAKCQEIADRAVALMLCRARVVDFAAVAVPWLQIGDFIQVIESSSTISEMYRITDIAFNQDPSGFTMNIKCYWYGTVS